MVNMFGSEALGITTHSITALSIAKVSIKVNKAQGSA